LSDQIKKNELDSACSTYWGEDRRIKGFHGGNLREGDHLEDAGVGGRIILKWILETWGGNIGCIDLAQDKDK
jgi:hypothetical protein